MHSDSDIRVGCAGWALEKSLQGLFPSHGTHLERYASIFPAVEINSSFYRHHKRSTYVRWAGSVDEGFRFCVKAPREITHARRLADCGAEWDAFLDEVSGLGSSLGPILVQLPPSLAWNAETCMGFLEDLRQRFQGAVALEPRHATWFAGNGEAGPGEAAEEALRRFRIARVAADPAVVPRAGKAGGWNGFAYHRLHGHPKMYYSKYPEAFLAAASEDLAREAGSGEAYCIFDNTAEGHAIPDALALMRMAGETHAVAPGSVSTSS
jgi:uncharacterized protein YecE (DUF72 family)